MKKPTKSSLDAESKYILRSAEKHLKIISSIRLEALGNDLIKISKSKNDSWKKAVVREAAKLERVSIAEAFSYSNHHLEIIFEGKIKEIDVSKIDFEGIEIISHITNVHIDQMSECKGDHIGRIFYKSQLDGRDALVARVCERHGIIPSIAASMSSEALCTLIYNDLVGVKIDPKLLRLFEYSDEQNAYFAEAAKSINRR